MHLAATRQINQSSFPLLGRAKAMLVPQADSLDSIFNTLMRKANFSRYLNQAETYLRLGLKAQSQCRAPLKHSLQSRIRSQWRSCGRRISRMADKGGTRNTLRQLAREL